MSELIIPTFDLKIPNNYDCRQNKRCLTGNNIGLAYKPGDECDDGFSFDPTACGCALAEGRCETVEVSWAYTFTDCLHCTSERRRSSSTIYICGGDRLEIPENTDDGIVEGGPNNGNSGWWPVGNVNACSDYGGLPPDHPCRGLAGNNNWVGNLYGVNQNGQRILLLTATVGSAAYQQQIFSGFSF